jgi:hypothetical protein
VLPPATISCDPAHELTRADPPNGKDPRALEWGGVDVERQGSTNPTTWERAPVSSEAGHSNSELRGMGRADPMVTFLGSADLAAIGDGLSGSSGDPCRCRMI